MKKLKDVSAIILLYVCIIPITLIAVIQTIFSNKPVNTRDKQKNYENTAADDYLDYLHNKY